MADKDFKVKSGLDLGTPLPLTEGGTGQTSAANALNALLPIQTDNSGKVLTTNGIGTTSWVTLPNGYQKGNTASRPGSPALGDIYSNTQTGYIEVYTAAGWSQLGVIPTSATIGSATDVGTSISFGSGSANVAFTAGSGGGLVTSFTAVSSPGSVSASATSSPIRVNGLAQGTAYTFTVTATNGYGNALASSASNSVTPTSVPQAPTVSGATNVTGVAFGSTCSASVSITANATGGKSITSYTVTSSPGGLTGSGGSPVTVAGLTSGTAYTFTSTATNGNGTSTSSASGGSLTPSTRPQAPTIGTVTQINATSVSVPFTGNSTGNSALIAPFYTVTSSPGGITATGSSSPITVSGLSTGTAYTFTVTATNANGSTASSASNSITPSVTLGAFSTATNYPASLYAMGSASPTSVGAMYAMGTSGFENNSASFYWNGSSWVSVSGAGSGLGPAMTATSATQVQIAGYGVIDVGANSSSFYSINGGSWSSATAIPYAGPVFSLGSNSIQIVANSSTQSHFRTGTGAWTSGTAHPITGGANRATSNGSTFSTGYAYKNTGEIFSTTSLGGAWTARTSPGTNLSFGIGGGHLFVYNPSQNNAISYYNGVSTTSTGRTIPDPPSATVWDSMHMAGNASSMSLTAGRGSGNANAPGINYHYIASVS
jgi:hypothetical protein